MGGREGERGGGGEREREEESRNEKDKDKAKKKRRGGKDAPLPIWAGDRLDPCLSKVPCHFQFPMSVEQLGEPPIWIVLELMRADELAESVLQLWVKQNG